MGEGGGGGGTLIKLQGYVAILLTGVIITLNLRVDA